MQTRLHIQGFREIIFTSNTFFTNLQSVQDYTGGSVTKTMPLKCCQVDGCRLGWGMEDCGKNKTLPTGCIPGCIADDASTLKSQDCFGADEICWNDQCEKPKCTAPQDQNLRLGSSSYTVYPISTTLALQCKDGYYYYPKSSYQTNILEAVCQADPDTGRADFVSKGTGKPLPYCQKKCYGPQNCPASFRTCQNGNFPPIRCGAINLPILKKLL